MREEVEVECEIELELRVGVGEWNWATSAPAALTDAAGCRVNGERLGRPLIVDAASCRV